MASKAEVASLFNRSHLTLLQTDQWMHSCGQLIPLMSPTQLDSLYEVLLRVDEHLGACRYRQQKWTDEQISQTLGDKTDES